MLVLRSLILLDQLCDFINFKHRSNQFLSGWSLIDISVIHPVAVWGIFESMQVNENKSIRTFIVI